VPDKEDHAAAADMLGTIHSHAVPQHIAFSYQLPVIPGKDHGQISICPLQVSIAVKDFFKTFPHLFGSFLAFPLL
jgi:hypothetical protein